jgi:hypothetical protein
MVDWQGYRRYKAALEDQAREKAQMEYVTSRKGVMQPHDRQRR